MTDTGTASLPLLLSDASGVAHEQQIVDQIPALVRAGELGPGSLLPPVRDLAGQLLVSPATVRRAYDRLEAAGLVVCWRGGPPRVVPDIEEVLRERRLASSRSRLARALVDMRRLSPLEWAELGDEADHLRRALEIDQAREMQRSLLPQAPPAVPGFDIAVTMKTAVEVGGDYYDFLPRPRGGARAVIGDATGHGLAAGMMAAMAKACLATIVAESPRRLMERANEVLRRVRRRRVMMAMAVVDVYDGRVTICSAGMPPLCLLRCATGEVEELALASPPLGSRLARSFPSRQIHLEPGDAVVAFSDGLPELRDRSGAALGTEAIATCLAASAGSAAGGIVDRLSELAASWADRGALEDDLTVLAVRRTAGNGS